MLSLDKAWRKKGKEGKKEKSEYLSPHPLGQLAEH